MTPIIGTRASGLRQVARFLVVGVVSTLINISIYWLLYRAGLAYALAMPIGFVSGAVFGYFANSVFTFAAPRRTLAAALRYITVNLVSLAVGEAVLIGLVEQAGLSVAVSSGMVLFVTTALNFLGAKFFAFGGRWA